MRPVHLLLTLALAVSPVAAQRKHARPAATGVPDYASPAKLNRSRAVFVGVGDAVMPYVLNGDGAVSKIRLINMEPRPVDFQLFFVGDDGSAATVELKDLTKVSKLSATIPANGATTIETSGRATNGNDQVVWAFFDASKARIATTLSVELNDGGFFNGSSYPASNVLENIARAPYDNSPGSDSGVNIVNLDPDRSVPLAITVRDIDGNTLYTGTKTVSSLGATDFYPADVTDTTKNARGSIEVSVAAGFTGGVAINGIRFFDKGGIDLFPGFAMPLQ